jgi:hypothetical protein
MTAGVDGRGLSLGWAPLWAPTLFAVRRRTLRLPVPCGCMCCSVPPNPTGSQTPCAHIEPPPPQTQDLEAGDIDEALELAAELSAPRLERACLLAALSRHADLAAARGAAGAAELLGRLAPRLEALLAADLRAEAEAAAAAAVVDGRDAGNESADEDDGP